MSAEGIEISAGDFDRSDVFYGRQNDQRRSITAEQPLPPLPPLAVDDDSSYDNDNSSFVGAPSSKKKYLIVAALLGLVAVVAVSVGVVTSNNKATATVNNNDVSSVNSAALAVDDEDNDEANNHIFTTSDHHPSYSRSQKTPTGSPTPEPTEKECPEVCLDEDGSLPNIFEGRDIRNNLQEGRECEADCRTRDGMNDCGPGLRCFKRHGGSDPQSIPGCCPNSTLPGDPEDGGPVNVCVNETLLEHYLIRISSPSKNNPKPICASDCDVDTQCDDDLVCFIRGSRNPKVNASGWDSNSTAEVPGCCGFSDGPNYCVDPNALSDAQLNCTRSNKLDENCNLSN